MFDSRRVKRNNDKTQNEGNFVTVFFNTSSDGRIESVTKPTITNKNLNNTNAENRLTKVNSETNTEKNKISRFDYKKSKTEKLPTFFVQSVHTNICFGKKTATASINTNNLLNDNSTTNLSSEFCNSEAFQKEKEDYLQRFYNNG